MRLTLLIIGGLGLIVTALFGLREETHCHRYARVLEECHDPDIIEHQLLLHGDSPFDAQQACLGLGELEDWPTLWTQTEVACLVASDGDCEFGRRCIAHALRAHEWHERASAASE